MAAGGNGGNAMLSMNPITRSSSATAGNCKRCTCSGTLEVKPSQDLTGQEILLTGAVNASAFVVDPAGDGNGTWTWTGNADGLGWVTAMWTGDPRIQPMESVPNANANFNTLFIDPIQQGGTWYYKIYGQIDRAAYPYEILCCKIKIDTLAAQLTGEYTFSCDINGNFEIMKSTTLNNIPAGQFADVWIKTPFDTLGPKWTVGW
jgi:hypothetical protein